MTHSMEAARVLLHVSGTPARRFLAEVLEEEGYVVVQIEDSDDLLDELSSDEGEPPVEVVVSSALEVLEEVREQDLGNPFVLLNFLSDPDIRHEAEALDAVVLDHPFEVDDLINAIQDMLEEPEAAAA